MNVFLTFLLSQSILLPVVGGLINYKRLGKLYFPFFILLLLGVMAELLSFIFIHTFKITNAPVVKVYSVIECCLVLYLLQLWRNSGKYRLAFICFAAACIAVWIIENLVFFNIYSFTPYFRIFYAFLLVLLSINQINAILVFQEGSLLKNPTFILCLGFIIFFTYQIIDEAALFIGSDKSVVADKIILGFAYINVIVNILYTAALFYIPKTTAISYEHYLNNT